MSGSKAVCGFSTTSFLKRLRRFKEEESMLFIEQNVNLKKKTKRNRRWKITHTFSETSCSMVFTKLEMEIFL